MTSRLAYIAFNTFREAVRDRVLYNLIFFALLMAASSILVGQISINVERQVVVNLGLTAVSLFGLAIAIFLGIGLVAKEIDKKTLYTLLSRPVRRWEFIVGKFAGLSLTLVVNTTLMAVGVLAALFYVVHKFTLQDASILIAIYFIILQFVVVTAIALLFSSFSSPILSAVFALAIFIIGTFAEDLRAFAQMARPPARWLAVGLAHLVPNFAALNVITPAAHGEPVAASLVFWNTVYALLYSVVAVSSAIIIFEYRDLK